MPLIASSETSGGFQLAPAGSHVARCCWVIDLGTQHDSYMNKPRITHKVRLGFELPNEKAVFDEEKGEEPFFVGKEYTLSLDPKANLRKDLESWRGSAFSEEQAKGFDLEKLLGVACMLTVQHGVSASKKQYAKIAGISPVPKGLPVPPQINASKFYSLEMGDNDLFRHLPTWIKETIMSSEEWKRESSNAAEPQGASQETAGQTTTPF